MTHVVAEPCVGSKYTDCVVVCPVVCPVECFYEGEQMLYIHPTSASTARPAYRNVQWERFFSKTI